MEQRRPTKLSCSLVRLVTLAVLATVVLTSCGSGDVEDLWGIVEIEYSNDGAAPMELDIIRVDWDDTTAHLEEAAFLDGVGLGISGDSPAQGSIDAIIPAGSTEWLKLRFDTGDAPAGLTVSIVTSTGVTLTSEFGAGGPG